MPRVKLGLQIFFQVALTGFFTDQMSFLTSSEKCKTAEITFQFVWCRNVFSFLAVDFTMITLVYSSYGTE